MKSLIRNILLVENRVDDVKRKYPDIEQEIIDYASQKDPSGNNKYLDWVIGHIMSYERLVPDVVNYSHDEYISRTKTKIDNIAKVLENFEKYGDKLNGERVYEAMVKTIGHVPYRITLVDRDGTPQVWNPKNINIYTSSVVLRDVIEYIKTKYPSKSEVKKETDIIYNDDLLLVVVPKTLKSSCKYGSGTKWCTTSVKYPHFKQYTDGDQGLVYYMFKNRNREPKKLALHWRGHKRGNLSYIWYDDKDNTIDGYRFLENYMGRDKTKEIDKIVNNYIKSSRGREISNPLLKWLKSLF